MKKKVGTILDEDIFLMAKQMAVMQKKTISQIIEEAINAYLSSQSKKSSIADQTQGILKISPKELKKIMEDEPFFES
jgi:hypothetical protein